MSTPLRWEEVERGLDVGDPVLLRFEMDAVRARIREHGDLFEPVLSRRQQLGSHAPDATFGAPRLIG